MAKFTEQLETDQWEIQTPSGWQDFSGIGKTIPYKVWIITTTNKELKCADNHIVYIKSITVENEINEVYTKDLKIGDLLLCEDDYFEEVISVIETDQIEEMYDITDVENGNVFYSNGIVSHNSTCVTSYLLHYCIFNPSVSVAILANKITSAKDLLDRFKISFENLPRWLQQGVVEWNKLNVQFENGAKIMASATSSSAVRGGSHNIIVLDEFAFVPNNIAENFFSSVYPTIASGKNSKVVIVSTPKGLNHFYKLWVGATGKKNGYIPVEAKWYDVPGRDENFKKQTIANTSQKQWDVEFECEFQGSENTLIAGSKLATLIFESPLRQTADGLSIYEEPIPNHVYTICVDTGKGEGQDYHAFSIIDCTQLPYKQVAAFRNNTISHQVYPHYVFKMASHYNEAFAMIEMNDLGQGVAELLHEELEYPNIVMVTNRGKSGQKADGGFGGGKIQLGLRTSYQSKQVGCTVLKEMIERESLILTDFDTISELSTYVSDGKGFNATEGYNDDLVSTLVLFAWLTTQSYYKDYTNSDVRKKMYEAQIRRIEEEILPFGFISDGLEPEDDGIDVFDERTTIEKRNERLSGWNF